MSEDIDKEKIVETMLASSSKRKELNW